MSIEPGLTGEIVRIVAESDTAVVYGSGLVPVLSTPHLIALMECAAQLVIEPFLTEEQTSVGIRVAMRHIAATPVGMQVRVRAEILEVDRRRLSFKVEAWDEVEKIGEAEHERFIVDAVRFMARVTEKAEAQA